jgi:FAD/FMN-containing dehydrogenase/Fe-S oxidoreductase
VRRVHEPKAAEVADLLRRRLRGRVYDDRRRRAEFSSDASNYRVVPQVVVEPMDTADVLQTLDVCRSLGVALTGRGGGTSIAGNAVGSGVVLDLSRHLNRVLEIDPDNRMARVEPGVVLSDLQRQVATLGLRFGPDPSSSTRATIGGMIGNNACGAHAVAYGRTADNVMSLAVVDGAGKEFLADKGSTVPPGLNALVGENLDVIRTELGRFSRQGSGYGLEHLLPENGRDLPKALVGSEGTLAITLQATLRLVPVSPARLLAVLGYGDMAAAADAVPALVRHSPLALEGLDARLVDVVRRHRGESYVPALPRGAGWLMVEVGGADLGEATTAARAMVRDAAALDSVVLPAGPEATALWRIREDAAGLAGRTPDGKQAWPGWEDASVPPERLGDYLRDFEALLREHGLHGLPYGHFGDGCIHVRIDLPLDSDTARFREFIVNAARLVVSHGGSCSGEHGDGRARSEVLSLMYSERMLGLFSGVKALFDPADILNPGVVVRPYPIDVNLRRAQARPMLATGGYRFTHDDGDFTRAVHRCVGVGKCRADNSAAGGFMCPSYLATRDEKDSTRGRARVLQELTNGSLVTGWSSPEVAESLDLCLSCKACSSDCPAGVDMAQYKSEMLFRKYRRRVRPLSHYSLGQLPRWLETLDRLPGVGAGGVNGVLRFGPARWALLRGAGMDARRRPPALARTTFRRWWSGQRAQGPVDAPGPRGSRGRVVLWVDSFTNALDPDVARAAINVLVAAGFDVVVPEDRACCGLTWITTGQLAGARRRLRGLLDVLGPYAEEGLPIVGVEPSCTAVLRSDLLDLLPDDPRTALVSGAARTLAELLTETSAGDGGWQVPELSGRQVVVQPHCHHHSVMGFAPDEKLLRDSGASVQVLAGCCGMAGNFGMERGHYDVSVAVAEQALLPTLRSGAAETVVLADGFSCRTQVADLAGRRAVHLAQLLAGQS